MEAPVLRSFGGAEPDSPPMKQFLVSTVLITALICASADAADRPIRLGVGVLGPISAQTEADIQRLVGTLPNVKSIPIVPPGDVDACVKRFVAGEADDRLDGVIVVSLPPDSFKTERDAKEAKFTGAYEIWTLDLSTLDEDRHRFEFTDTEPVIGKAAAILTIPAQLFAERATGRKLLSTDEWQAYEAVQGRVEGKLLAATKLYLSTATIRNAGPLNPLECARQLVDRGDADTAVAVFKSIGMNTPEVQRVMVEAQQKLKRADADALLGRTLGAIAGGDATAAGTILAQYEKNASAEPARATSIRNVLSVSQDHRAESAYERVMRSDVPALDHSAFVAMLKQLFSEQTGSQPGEVTVTAKDVVIEDKNAEDGVKKKLDGYAGALAKSAWLMSVKCGCDAGASLVAEPAGSALLKAHCGPSFKRPEVGIP
jgi:hypothetical protein